MNWSHFLITIRWQNMFIIWLIQAVIYFRYVLPYCSPAGYSFISFLMFLGATGSILGAGNIFNDIKDIHTDALHPNKPKLIGQEISISKAWKWHTILTGISVIFLLAGWWIYDWKFSLLLLFLLGITLLYLYSGFFKGTILTGNLIVATLCTLPVWMTSLLAPSCELSQGLQPGERISVILYGYIANAFMITLLREMVKDKEDAPADMKADIFTIGSIDNSTYRLTFNVILLLTALINGFWFYLLRPVMTAPDWNLGLFMIFIPLFIIILIFNLRHKSKIYTFLSKLIKVYILFAILLLILWQRTQ